MEFINVTLYYEYLYELSAHASFYREKLVPDLNVK
jgi:hypothetical protein